MTTQVTQLQATLVVLAGLSVTLGILEFIARRLAPPTPDDPRLGLPVFWLWVAMVAAVTYSLLPLFEFADRPVTRILAAVWAIAWLGWKFGLSDWDDTAREKEEAWATGVGVVIAVVGRGFSG